MLMDKKKQNEKIMQFIDENVERIPLIKIKRWAREKDIIEYMAKFGMSATTTKRRLQELVDTRNLQTKTWGGRRFYAPPTIPLPFLLAIVFTLLSVAIYYPVLYLGVIGEIILFFIPFYMAISLVFLDKKINNSGICIECGKSLSNGELYCEEHKRDKGDE